MGADGYRDLQSPLRSLRGAGVEGARRQGMGFGGGKKRVKCMYTQTI